MLTLLFSRKYSTSVARAALRLLGVALLSLSVAPFSIAKDVTLSLENADIQDLIQWASQHIEKTIIVHPNVKGKVSVLAGEPIDEEDAYNVFISVLQVHGFAVVETTSSIKILPDALAKQSGAFNPDREPLGEEMVVRLIKVNNISVTPLISLLRPLMPQVAHLGAYPQSNALIVADRADNIERIINIVRDIDNVGTIDIEVVPLKFASANEILDVIENLLGQGNKKDSANPLTFVADDRSNSILVTGDPVSRQQVIKLIEQLDQPLAGEGNTQVIYVYYANAADLVPILESVTGTLQKSEKDKPFDSGEVSIQASDANNALIITAPLALLDTMKAVIQKLDIRRRQVLVEAVIVEVNDDVLDDLGVQWRTGSVADGIISGFNALPTQTSNDVFPTIGSGMSLGYMHGDSLRALVNALETNTSANILSTPTIVTLDNEEAEILVGSNEPVITGSESRDNNDNPFQTIERQDIGITLKVKPRINENDSMTLAIEQTVESVSSRTDQGITTNKRNIKTNVLLENDQVLVLGGLITDEIKSTETRVPILGHIPVLGHLFKSTNTQVRKNNLMVFIHPLILIDPAASRAVTSERYNDLRNKQQQYNEKPKRIFIPENPPLLPELNNGVMIKPSTGKIKN
jgi:general secretion pathway protein D